MVMRRPPPASLNPFPPTVGSIAPDFTLSDYNGKVYRLSDYRGKKVLLNFFCGCGLCRVMAREWGKQFADLSRIQLLAVANFSPATAVEFRNATGIKFPLLLDPFGKVAQRYQSVACPRCWLLSESGKVVYGSPQGLSPALIAKELSSRLNRQEGSGGSP
jgi:peroxiredoxin